MAGGNTVVLTGSGFPGTTVVLFGGNDATSFTVDSPTRITSVAPAGPAGAAAVRVVTPGGVSDPVTYFYTTAPVLSSVAPSRGPVAGSATVVLTGTGLTVVQSVLFGNTAATGLAVESSTRMTAVTPPGPPGGGTVQVTAVSPAGTGGPVPYTYVAGPVVTSAVPSQGPLHGGTPVTLKGSGLTTTTAVRFGTEPAGFTVESDSSVVATAPPGVAGPVPVTVSTPSGTSAPVVFTRVAPPSV
ncbi:IPT/TIG domain-containing protein [Streptomyces meridianus]|uniref:IPT/TIG domain-containing protein n=1 Tax=Streptomyces meridianus TaxID=2938945 RepID=A0ABT0X6G8_9ACTN|nr:IPT/TIG domain-containing protein [Streptomyces meridianus]